MENNLVIPQHIAIIMDGNGRWAAKHSLERCEGHRMGAEALKNLMLLPITTQQATLLLQADLLAELLVKIPEVLINV